MMRITKAFVLFFILVYPFYLLTISFTDKEYTEFASPYQQVIAEISNNQEKIEVKEEYLTKEDKVFELALENNYSINKKGNLIIFTKKN